ncbi:hypothetical protein MIR68_002414 [Amoeboaphelidium protococcarum]|nr:hypothetical protein MIR68_002414 [Amoeboaphelidium protococcarum]KAI3652230.1 hypothetical protein MP228_003533 [Amoeboaphelidium protococcarum]
MPGLLPAPESLLNAIFLHTNKLGFEDRQTILRFLGGEGSPQSRRRSREERGSQSTQPQQQNNNRNVSSQTITTLPDGTLRMELTAPLNIDGVSAEVENNPVVQILLHEERRQEERQSASSRTINSDGQLVPEFKTYTILDQIIFEMDYSTGCWRKLRRRVRLNDKKLQQNDAGHQHSTSIQEVFEEAVQR